MKLKIIILLLIPFLGFSQTNTKEKRKSKIVILPDLGYTPETSFKIGAVAFFNNFWNNDTLNKKSSQFIYANFTLKKQFNAGLESDNWFKQNKEHLYLDTNFKKFPFTYYNSANNNTNESFTSSFFRLRLTYERELYKKLYLGAHIHGRTERITKVEKGKFLASKDIIGSEDFYFLGFGPAITYDTRNAVLYPTNGVFHQLKVLHYNKSLSNLESFNMVNLDLRKYINIVKENHVLAFNLLYQFTDNKNIPFQILPSIGGDFIQRGYLQSRYRGTNRMVFRTDYRFPVFKKVKLALIGNLGSVASSFSELFENKIRPAGGLGVRYNYKGIDIRFDFVYGGRFTPYIKINESF